MAPRGPDRLLLRPPAPAPGIGKGPPGGTLLVESVSRIWRPNVTEWAEL